MARVTVFGAGTMGTAVAMHLARGGHETVLWAAPFDRPVLGALLEERRHPRLPDHLPESVSVRVPEDLETAGKGIDLAVLGAHAAGARGLARLVREGCGELPVAVSVAKGLEPGTGRRMTEVYAEELGHDRVVQVTGPCLATEMAQGLHTSVVFACPDLATAEWAAALFRSRTFHVTCTDDVAGAEYCSVAKNVATIALGIVDGLSKVNGIRYENAKAALFSLAYADLVRLTTALGGRAETAGGLAGLGDVVVTSLGGRNRLFGEVVGTGADPWTALEELTGQGITVEGVEAAREVMHLAERAGVHLPVLSQVHRILFEMAPPASVFDCLKR